MRSLGGKVVRRVLTEVDEDHPDTPCMEGSPMDFLALRKLGIHIFPPDPFEFQ